MLHVIAAPALHRTTAHRRSGQHAQGGAPTNGLWVQTVCVCMRMHSLISAQSAGWVPGRGQHTCTPLMRSPCWSMHWQRRYLRAQTCRQLTQPQVCHASTVWPLPGAAGRCQHGVAAVKSCMRKHKHMQGVTRSMARCCSQGGSRLVLTWAGVGDSHNHGLHVRAGQQEDNTQDKDMVSRTSEAMHAQFGCHAVWPASARMRPRL